MLKCCLSHQLDCGISLCHRFLHMFSFVKPLTLMERQLNRQNGFTLLELLVVIGILGIISLAATTYIIDTGELKRQDETEKRWDAMRKAMIGEPNVTLNGSPYVSGYVADMGRLPQNIQELFIQGAQPAWTEVDLYTAAPGYSSAFGGGWRGPYLYTAGSRFFRDGWNNEDFVARNDGVNDDATNFGWVFTPTGTPPDHTDIVIQSLGDNNAIGGAEFFEDFPADNTLNIVSQNEWTVTSPINFNINFTNDVPSNQSSLELRVYRYIDNNDAIVDGVDIEETAADATFDLVAGAAFSPVQTITPIDLPIGRYAAVIWCTNNTPLNINDDTVYDGDCATPNSHNPYFFTLLPGVSQVTISWNLP